VREMRTGVSRSTMALDPEALQNQTATASNNQKDSAYSQVELIARNQAELGWKRVFRQILKLIVKHQDRPRTIRLRDTWVEMDPRSWNSNMDATINIGLGTGSRDRDMAMLNTILNVQIAMTDRLAQGGFSAQALEMVPKINLTATKLAESAGIKNPDQFYLDIKPEMLEQMKQEAASRPDPAIETEKMKAQLQAQTQLQLGQQQAQIDAQADQRKAQIEAVQMQADIEAQNKKTEAEMIQSEREFQLKKELAIMQATLDAEVAAREDARKAREFEAKMAFEREKHQQTMKQGELGLVATAQAHDTKIGEMKAQGEREKQKHEREAKTTDKAEKPKGPIKFKVERGADGKISGAQVVQ